MLTMPVSSSRFKNTAPCALSGCWRWVTTPPTMIRSPLGLARRAAAGSTPRRSSRPRASSMAVVSGAIPSDHRSSATSSHRVGRGSGGGSDPVTTPGSRSAVAWEAAPAPHTRDRRSRARDRPATLRPGAGARAAPGRTVEGPGGGQGLQLGPGDTGPAHQVLHARPRPPLLDPGRRLLPDAAHRGQPEPHGRPRSGPGPTPRARRRPSRRSRRGARTATPWRLASATRLWGDQNPMGWALSSPAVNAAG